MQAHYYYVLGRMNSKRSVIMYKNKTEFLELALEFLIMKDPPPPTLLFYSFTLFSMHINIYW